MKQTHRILAEYQYAAPKVQQGYAGQTLYVNVATGHIESRPVDDEMKEKFVGGKGFGLWRLWHAVTGETKWNDPENEIVIASGPLAGTILYPGTGKSLVVGISPLTGIVVDSNVGGYFGPLLKVAGWDALEVQGKAAEEVVVFIDGDAGRVTVEAAPQDAVNTHLISEQLTAMYAKDDGDKRNVSVVSAGQGSEHTRIGCLNVSWYDPRRKAVRVKQAGRGGLGTVLRDKKIKAIVVPQDGLKAEANDPADIKRDPRGRPAHQQGNRRPGRRAEPDAPRRHRAPGRDHERLRPAAVLQLPLRRAIRRRSKIHSKVWDALFTQGIPDACFYGCTMACSKGVDQFRVAHRAVQGRVRHGRRPGVRDGRGLRVKPGHLRAAPTSSS